MTNLSYCREVIIQSGVGLLDSFLLHAFLQHYKDRNVWTLNQHPYSMCFCLKQLPQSWNHARMFRMTICYSITFSHHWDYWRTYSSMTTSFHTKWDPWRHDVPRVEWKNTSGLHRALTSTLTEHHCDELEQSLLLSAFHPTSVPDLIKVFGAEWSQIPRATLKHLVKSLPRRVEVIITAKAD